MSTPKPARSITPGITRPRARSDETVGLFGVPASVTAAGSGSFPEGWTAYASWIEDWANVITSITATWTVPPAPNNTTDDQLIYLFNGLQDYDPLRRTPIRHILQPVLTWGRSPDGDGPYWTVASWYFDNKERGFKSPSVKVNVGDTLTGLIQLTDHDENRFNYSCEFVGISGTTLRVVGVEQLVMPCIVLECHNIRSQDDYPSVLNTTMKAINVTTKDGPIGLKFQRGEDANTGQHAVVDNTKRTVDLFYRLP